MNQQLSPIQSFDAGLKSERNVANLKKYLGSDKAVETFTRVCMRVVQEDSDLLHPEVDQKTLFFACEQAAQDGLMPDGKEGFLAIYNKNLGTRDAPNWIKTVQWQPMIEGMRKALAVHHISLRAELVYEKDEFRYDKGDNPVLIHNADVFSLNRGEMIGAYAIARDTQTGIILGRCAMNAKELEDVRGASKNPNGSVWKKWPGPMYAKAPARRLFKEIPRISDLLSSVIKHDNLTFDMDKPPQVTDAAEAVQAHVRLLPKADDDYQPGIPATEMDTARLDAIQDKIYEYDHTMSGPPPELEPASEPSEPDF